MFTKTFLSVLKAIPAPAARRPAHRSCPLGVTPGVQPGALPLGSLRLTLYSLTLYSCLARGPARGTDPVGPHRPSAHVRATPRSRSVRAPHAHADYGGQSWESRSQVCTLGGRGWFSFLLDCVPDLQHSTKGRPVTVTRCWLHLVTDSGT